MYSGSFTGLIKVAFSTKGEGEVAVRKGSLELHKPGNVTLKAEYGAEGQAERIQANTEKVVQVRPVHVVTDLHQEPNCQQP